MEPDEIVSSQGGELKFVTRAVATVLVEKAFAVHEVQLLPFFRDRLIQPDCARLHNYEFETDYLPGLFGGNWIISEWCPFDGYHCAWYNHAPPDVLKQLADDLAAHRKEWYALPEKERDLLRAPVSEEAIAEIRRDAEEQCH